MSVIMDQEMLGNLTTDEWLELLGFDSDSITDSESNPPIPVRHIEELARRRAAAIADPGVGIHWEQVRNELVSKPVQITDCLL